MTLLRASPANVADVLAAARAGDRVVLEKGEYSAQLTIDKAITIEGQGPGTWIGNVAAPVIRVTCAGVELRDFDIEARTADEAALVYAGDAPVMHKVRSLRGKVLAAGITFAPVPVILLRDAPERRRMPTAPIALAPLPPSSPPSPIAAPKPPKPQPPVLAPKPPPPAASTMATPTASWRPAPDPINWRIIAGIAAAIAVGGAIVFSQSRSTNATNAVTGGVKVDEARPMRLPPEPEEALVPIDPCAPSEADRVFYYTKRTGDPRPFDPEYWAQGLVVAREVHARLPDCVDVTSALAYIIYRVNYRVCADGDSGEAMTLIDDAMSKAPGDTAVLRNRGRILAAQRRWTEALAQFERASRLERNNQSREWIYSLRGVIAANERMLVAARGVVAGDRVLGDDELQALDLADLAVVEAGLAAKYGKSLELQPTDWLYFCSDSPLGVDWHPRLDPDATSATVNERRQANYYDLENSRRINERQQQARAEETY